MALSSPHFFAAIFAASLAGASSCAEPDPPYGDPNGIAGKKLPNESASTAPTTSSGGTDNTPFSGAYDANANKPSTTLVASHAAAASKGAPSAIDAPLVCSDCHKSGGVAQAKIWAFGGRVMKGSAGVPNVDVIITGTATLGPVKSDADGFFWLAGTPIGAGAKATIRNASGKSSMTGTPGPACDTSGCHQDGAQGRVGKGLP